MLKFQQLSALTGVKANIAKQLTLESLNKTNGSIAQLVEHETFNLQALGSSPSGPTIYFER